MISVMGHRGAAGVRPENTIQGFEYAIDLGVDLVECDVHLTWDQHLVVMHDETVNRTTNGVGLIAGMTFETIRALDAGEGQRVPTLDEVLDTVKGRVDLLCELKGEGVEGAAVEAVRAHGMEANVAFTSFDLDRLARARALGDELRLGAIFLDPGDEEIARALELNVAGVGVYYKNLCLRLVERIRDAGLELRAWNPDTLPEQRAMIALGVTGVGTNRPDILIEYLKTARDD